MLVYPLAIQSFNTFKLLGTPHKLARSIVMLSFLEAYLVRASRRDCLDDLFEVLSIRELCFVARCSDILRTLVICYQATTWDVDDFLSNWTDEPDRLRYTMRSADAIVAGPTLLRFLARVRPDSLMDLQIICRIEGLSILMSFLSEARYRKVASDPDLPLDNLTMHIAARRAGDGTWGMSSTDRVLYSSVFEWHDHPNIDSGPLPVPTITLDVVDADPRRMIFKQPTSTC